jgi:hypothetical protein
MRSTAACALLLTLAALLGCGSVPLAEQPPAGFNLNGEWRLDPRASDGQVRGRGGLGSGFMSQDFPLLVAQRMRIEQDARSMGIEYERGRYRDVSWGERRRGVWDVRAGWIEDELRIYSEAPDTSAVEIWRLSEDGQRLTIDVQVKGPRSEQFQRTFVRSPGI